MAEGNGHSGPDAGVSRETRTEPCAKFTWCIGELGHDGPCTEYPRAPREQSEWDRRTPDPRGWRDQKRSR